MVKATASVTPGLIEVKIGGDPEVVPEYSRKLRLAAAGLPVQFLGPLDRSAVAALLAGTDVLCVPSRWYENSPLVVAEAFAMGVPVMASNIGALAEKVRDGVDGLLHPPGDSGALARLLQQAATQPGLLPRLRDGIRPGLSRAQHEAAMEAVYAELCGRAAAGARTV